MKRHNFGGLRGSHGVKKGNRQRGSISSTPATAVAAGPRRASAWQDATGPNVSPLATSRSFASTPTTTSSSSRGGSGPNGGFIMIRPTNKKGLGLAAKKG
jgi:hypothetical protein